MARCAYTNVEFARIFTLATDGTFSRVYVLTKSKTQMKDLDILESVGKGTCGELFRVQFKPVANCVAREINRSRSPIRSSGNLDEETYTISS